MNKAQVDRMSLFVYITHFQKSGSNNVSNQQKVKQLADLILGLSRINVKRLEISVFTNLRNYEELNPIFKPIESRLRGGGHWNINLVSTEEMTIKGVYNPWLLTWSHKHKLKQDVLKSKKDSLFLYLEDDAIFLQDNLEYFLEFRPKLQKIGLIPGFLRAEFSPIHITWTNPDIFPNQNYQDSQVLDNEGELLLLRQYENPFSASILLDLQLAHEYLRSKAFFLAGAQTLHPIIWDTGATAALGLISERVPLGYSSRVAVILNSQNSLPLLGAVLRHQGDRYASDVWQRHFLLFDSSDKPTMLNSKRSRVDIVTRLWEIGVLNHWRRIK